MSELGTFDPWRVSAEEALRAHDRLSPEAGAPDPLVQFQAVQQILQAKQECLSPAGGCAVLRCLSLCLVHALQPPQWLSDAFVLRHSRVTEAEVGSWDEAFGAPWAPRTRLDRVRRHRRLKQSIHAAVWRRLEADPGQAVNRDFFEQVGEELDAGASGSLVEKLYQEALREGMTNPLHVLRPYQANRAKCGTEMRPVTASIALVQKENL